MVLQVGYAIDGHWPDRQLTSSIPSQNKYKQRASAKAKVRKGIVPVHRIEESRVPPKIQAQPTFSATEGAGDAVDSAIAYDEDMEAVPAQASRQADDSTGTAHWAQSAESQTGKARRQKAGSRIAAPPSHAQCETSRVLTGSLRSQGSQAGSIAGSERPSSDQPGDVQGHCK